MCYQLYISTDTPLELTLDRQMDLFFVPQTAEQSSLPLQHKHIYHLASPIPSGCSCAFRILPADRADTEGFHLPPKEADETYNPLEAQYTRGLFRLIRQLVKQGHPVDSYVTSGEKSETTPLQWLDVPTESIRPEEFALFERVYFTYLH